MELPQDLKDFTAEPERGYLGFLIDLGYTLAAIAGAALLVAVVIAVLSLGAA